MKEGATIMQLCKVTGSYYRQSPDEVLFEAQRARVPLTELPAQLEYDFIEQPSQDFFCPVTLELIRLW